MLFPLLVGVVAVAFGALLALGPPAGEKSIGPIRILSVVAALFVIGWHLMPEAVHALGVWSVVAFGIGLIGPKALETIMERVTEKARHHHDAPAGGGTSHTALEIGYVGLIVHRFGDGLSMGAYARVPGSPSAGAPVLLAFAAHIVPVTTVMVLAALAAKGRKVAVYYAIGLGVAVAAGVLLATAALTELSSGIEPWISAVVAGLLLHVVVHSVPSSVFRSKKE